MIRRVLKAGFSATSDLLSTKNIRKFVEGDFPEALNYSRPFSNIITKLRFDKIEQWSHSSI